MPPQPPSDGPLLTFDGGARHHGGGVVLPPDGAPAVGAGASLWTTPDAAGHRRCIMQLPSGLPLLRVSFCGEAAGLAFGLRGVLAACPAHLWLNVMGDNLPIVRLGAATGTIRTDGVWAALEDPLMDLCYRRWLVAWAAVRREHNLAADDLATAGVLTALRLRERGDRRA